jgi:hypothetical protein
MDFSIFTSHYWPRIKSILSDELVSFMVMAPDCTMNGKTWISAVTTTKKELDDITWNGTRFIAVGQSGVVLVGERR